MTDAPPSLHAPPLEVRLWSDLGYQPQGGPRQSLDVYAPRDASEAPVVVFVHGGALLFGDKRLNAHVGLRLAAAGMVCVAPNHRFSPAVAHPEHIRDLAAAVRWTIDHVGGHGGDPGRLVVAGHSSGGYLAALLGTDPRWLAEQDLTPGALAGVAPISGFFHVERLAPERPKHVWGEQPEAWPDASPVGHVGAHTPPMLLAFADGDSDARQAENRDFAAALQAQGRSVTLLEAAQRDHHTIFYLLNLPEDRTMSALLDFVIERTGG